MATDPRMIARFGKEGWQLALKELCVEQCAGCKKEFAPEPAEVDGKTRCLTYINPAAKWESGKTCPFMYVPRMTKEEKIKNSSKANRGSKRVRRQAAAAQHVAEKAEKANNKKK